MDKILRMKELINKILEYNKYYYKYDKPLISDDEWDKLYFELVKLEKETGKVLKNSPTQKVGDEVLKGFKKVKHDFKLYSLNKCQNYSDLTDWLDSMENKFGVESFAVEYKFDGLKIVCEYNNGKFIKASTRGNGVVGEDVSKQVETIKTLPKEIDFMGKLLVVGEAMIRKSTLKAYNEKMVLNGEPEKELKNERNAVAGAIRNLDINVTKSRNLDLFLYDVLYIENKEFSTQKEMHNFLIENKFSVWDYFRIANNNEEVIEYLEEIDKIKDSLDIAIDGGVVKINEVPLRSKIGFTNKFPKWAMAYKFAPREKVSRVVNVLWQVGRTGKLTPIAEIEPVELAGATVKRVTLNNYDDILRKNVKINSDVVVRRSNEVIPEILGAKTHYANSIDIKKPETCPVCGEKTINDGVNIYCTNKNCAKQINEKIVHFCSRNAMNIEGVNDKTVEKLRLELGITSVVDLYKITKDELLSLENFKDKKANNFIKNVEKSKDSDLSRFIYALSIPNVGEKTASDLAKKFKNLNSIISANYEEFLEVNDIGEIIAKNLIDFFNSENGSKIINGLLSVGVKPKFIENEVNFIKEFSDKTIVLTGSLEKFTRDEAGKLLEKFGANISTSVSKKTDLVIYGDNAGSKLNKAKEFGIETMSEEEFIDILNKNQ